MENVDEEASKVELKAVAGSGRKISAETSEVGTEGHAKKRV